MEKIEAILKKIKVLIDRLFTGSIRINFHKGNISSKLEITEFEELERYKF